MTLKPLSRSVVVVTGASSGIGRATVLAFAEQGSAVVAAARRKEPLDELVEECRSRGAAAIAVPTDVTDEEAVRHLARTAAERLGGIDVWVNNAAVTLFAMVEDAPMDAFRRVVDTNLFGYLHGARAVLPVFRAQGSGVLVNNASLLSVVTQPYVAAYVLSKHAVRALSQVLRQELAVSGGRGIEVCTVLPAAIDTPLFQHGANVTGYRARAIPPVYAPERVARTIVDLARLPRHEAYVGGGARLVACQARLTPGLVESMLATLTGRLHLDHGTPVPPTMGTLFTPMAEGTGTTGGWRDGWSLLCRSAGAALALGAGAATAIPRSVAGTVTRPISRALRGLLG